ncbi:enoyl-CoA hydratase-related protein [Mesorhizobium sp.]|uniref:enoyl-CoA hydratase/isomerase family protein n=1 Tax=Mesorhizobium sp. TaxID=1871066 RepID=UPI000FE533EA|nr:enoyl-CoA hydratase-related protein [Mesorhizobium sp.]RWG01520.1 MAG: enoyl-CoA hydratase/isomerase family protein [Mesorhizobium sp.]RWG97635.1 MAG: enoyl-CoA hydratase/isomerase family protein [Mesorhizobium sp.]TIN48691.1 MAG: enoyl-CoA hydratase/isomerase family protein [Mesorhizobium sp.]TIR92572.1 MAG: enoyl-CoA hydratase/isomerase family protein [Mesorhizobium sp.]TIS04568.1 MAG: enoyl-CoA hydratase/isomerase family protein [Mesorhizobium sp.]
MTVRHDIVSIERRGSVGIIWLHNPPLNVVTKPLSIAFRSALQAVETDAAIRALVITGTGDRAFCAGSDIREFSHDLAPGEIVSEKLALQNEVFLNLERFSKPTIAAITGLAFGGGLEIAICCDLIVAEERSTFALPEIKLGVFPGSGGTIRVARRIGKSRAKEMMLLGDPIDARAALQWGLINRVADTGSALQCALDLAQRLAIGPALALKECKDIIEHSWELPMREALQRSMSASDRVFRSDEKREGVAAFLEKRSPNFAGKR